MTVVGRSLSRADRTPCLRPSGSQPLRSDPNLQIRRSGHIVQDRLLRSVCWADIPELSAVTFPERSERGVGHMKAGSSGELAPQALGGRRRLRASYAAIGLAALVLLLAIAVIPFTLAARQGVLYNVGQVATFLPIAAVGFMVAWHRPRNPIGWLLIVTAAGALLTVDGQLYAWLIYRLGHHLPFGPAALLLAFAWLTNFVTLPLAILLFPDGVLPARWRWVLWAYVAVTGFLLVSEYIAVVGLMAANDVRIDASGGLAALDNRSGGTAWLSPVRAVIFPIMVVFWLSFIARLLLSWRRASIERRQQLKWLLTGCAITLASGVLSIASVPAAFQSAVDFISDLGFVALPVCAGIAILKYRLYDIDRIISRALAYAIVTGVLIGLYTGLVLLATRGCPSAPRWRWPPPRWPRRRCSILCGSGFSGSWTGGSIGPDTTPTRSWPPSRPG